MTELEARKSDACMHCGRTPTLAKRKDAAGTRAVLWCFACKRLAFGGSSFIKATPAALEHLPLVEKPHDGQSDRQGSLF